jgi:hypothetical protein
VTVRRIAAQGLNLLGAVRSNNSIEPTASGALRAPLASAHLER